MPEYPDIEVYLDALSSRVLDRVLERIEVLNPFVLRTVAPRADAFAGQRVRGLSRLGKRIVFAFDDERFAVLHLMIAGRLHWNNGRARRKGLVRLHFDAGTLVLTEAGSKRRASLHLLQGKDALRALDPGGRDVFAMAPEDFRDVVRAHNHTLKRFLTDPKLLSGIGNAYSDEILHRAGLSPVQLTGNLDAAAIDRLYEATRVTLSVWRERLARECNGDFPTGVTAFREGMAVHGRYREPCPVCATPVQRIRYAENETNYCPTCQTGGRVLADRALSRLLKQDWPRTVEELENRRGNVPAPPRRA